MYQIIKMNFYNEVEKIIQHESNHTYTRSQAAQLKQRVRGRLDSAVNKFLHVHLKRMDHAFNEVRFYKGQYNRLCLRVDMIFTFVYLWCTLLILYTIYNLDKTNQLEWSKMVQKFAGNVIVPIPNFTKFTELTEYANSSCYLEAI